MKKKWYLLILLIALSIIYCSCNDSEMNNLVGYSDQWKIYRLNDTVFVCLPYYHADDDLNPVVINLKQVNIQ